MEARAIKRHERLTPRKANLVLKAIRHRNVAEVLRELRFSPRRSSKIVLKVLQSAVSNAKNQDPGLDDSDLIITKAVADKGITMKRAVPRSRGMANPIRKYTSHITIVVADAVRLRSN